MYIRYWKGIVGPEAILATCAEEIEQLKSGDYKSLGFEKLHVSGENLYSIRVNKADRLILTEHHGALIILEYVENHNYERSQFLKGRGVAEYLNRKLGLTVEEMTERFNQVNDEELGQLESRAVQAVPFGPHQELHDIELHGRRWVELTEVQEQAAHAQLPLMLFGPGGSGKSAIALSMLHDVSLQVAKEDVDAFSCLYLSESVYLVEEMQSIFSQMTLGDESVAKRIRFTTITEFLISDLGIPKEKLVQKDDFLAWWEKLNKYKKLDFSEDIIWEEFGICAACKNKEEYEEHLGQRQSLIDKKYRSQIYKLYSDYNQYVEERGLISYSLLNLTMLASKYALILIDEAQNVPPNLIKIFSQLASQDNIVYLLGEQQSIGNRISNIWMIKKNYHEKKIKCEEYHLTKTHRLSKKIAKLVNELMRLKRLEVGGLTEKNEQILLESVEHAPEGQIYWMQPKDIEKYASVLQIESVDFAVVTKAQYVAEIREILPNAVIFTVAEAQGLSIKNLLVYKVHKSLSAVLVKAMNNPEHSHRGLRDELNLINSKELDTLITAMTRAEESLTIVEDNETYHEQILKDHFSPFCTNLDKSLKVSMNQKPSTPEEWAEKAINYMRLGHKTQALHIWCSVLGRSKRTLFVPLAYYAKSSDGRRFLKQQFERDAKFLEEIIVEDLFSSDLKEKADSIAFNLLARCSDGQSLLRTIFEKNPEFLEAITPSILYSLRPGCIGEDANTAIIHWLVKYADGQMLLKQLFSRKPTLLEAITPSVLCALRPQSAGADANSSLMYWLMKYSDGRTLLKQIFALNPAFLDSITPPVLFTSRPENVGDDACTSLIYWLAKYYDGQGVLKELITLKPTLLDAITPSVLCTLRPEDAKEGANTSLLYWLSKHSKGQEILELIFKEKKEIMREISCESLCVLVADSVSQEINTSAFCWLSGSKQGQSLLKFLFTNNPNLIKKISIRNFYFVWKEPQSLYLSRISKQKTLNSPFYILSKTRDGRELINLIFFHNRALFKNLPYEALVRTAVSGDFLGTSPLYFLTMVSDGCELLKFIFKENQNQDFIRMLTVDSLCSPITSSGKYENTSPFYWLTSFSTGRTLLKYIFSENTKLVSSLTVNHLCLPLTEAALWDTNVSPLYWLSGNKEGLELLNIILEQNKSIFENLRADALFRNLEAVSGMFANTSPFYFLSNTAEGIELLIKIFDMNYNLTKYLDIKMLCSQRPSIAGKEANISPFYLLARSPRGIELLTTIFRWKYQLFNELTAEHLCTPITSTAGENANTSSLYWLSMSVQGRKFLNKIIERNENLKKSISGEFLCIARTDEAGLYANTSPLYWLAENPDGLILILLIFPEGITGQSLCLSRNPKAAKDENVSSLYLLLRNPGGRHFLFQVVSKNPNISPNITAKALCLSLTAAAGPAENTSPLYFAASSRIGQRLLSLLFDQNPQLLQDLTADALCLPLTAAAGANANMSALYWLSYNLDGQLLLMRLFKENPALMKGITPESLRLLVRSEHSANVSVLYWLSVTKEGQDILSMLLEENPALCGSMEEAFLRQVIVNRQDNSEQSIWDNLASSEIGLALREKLLKRPSYQALFFAQGVANEAGSKEFNPKFN